MRLCVNSKAMQVKVQREKESFNGTMKENCNRDQVWLDSRNLKTIYHKKMKPKREGPFSITEVLGPVTYRLQLPVTWWIHNVFHAALLWLYKENEVYGENFAKPPPELENNEEFYEVETILNHRKRGWGYQYFVKWQGYPITDASWCYDFKRFRQSSTVVGSKVWGQMSLEECKS